MITPPEDGTFQFEVDAEGHAVLVIAPMQIRCTFKSIETLEKFVAQSARALADAKARAGVRTVTC